MALTRRTQVLLDETRYERLRRRSAATNRSVGALIREAIDQLLLDEPERREAAAGLRREALASFLAAEPMPVDEWAVIEGDLEGSYARGLDPA